MLECHTERMHLRELRASDEAEFLRYHDVSRAHLAAWIPAAEPEELFRRALATTSYEGPSGRTHLRLVGETPDERIAGLFSLGEIVRGFFRCAYASWEVGEEYKNRGYGTEGVRGLLDIAFSEEKGLGLHRVQANIIPSNVASTRLAEKVGFRREGLAERYRLIAGEWRDHAMYAKTVEEHEARYL
jgi:ribosomal-protein-alanine N-acetyltransferase